MYKCRHITPSRASRRALLEIAEPSPQPILYFHRRCYRRAIIVSVLLKTRQDKLSLQPQQHAIEFFVWDAPVIKPVFLLPPLNSCALLTRLGLQINT